MKTIKRLKIAGGISLLLSGVSYLIWNELCLSLFLIWFAWFMIGSSLAMKWNLKEQIQ